MVRSGAAGVVCGTNLPDKTPTSAATIVSTETPKTPPSLVATRPPIMVPNRIAIKVPASISHEMGSTLVAFVIENVEKASELQCD